MELQSPGNLYRQGWQDGDYEPYSSPTSGVDAAMELLSPGNLLIQGTQDRGYDPHSSPTSGVDATMEPQNPGNLLIQGTPDGDYETYSSSTSGVEATMEKQSPETQGTKDVVHLDAAGGNGDSPSSSGARMVDIVPEDMNWFRCTVCSRLFRPPVFKLQCKAGHLACGGCLTGQCRRCPHRGGDNFFAGGPCRNAVVEDLISVSPTSSMLDRSSDGDDGEKYDWETNAEPLPASPLSNLDAPDLSMVEADVWAHGEPPPSSSIDQYVEKDFPKEMILKAIEAIGNNHANALHEPLLKYKSSATMERQGTKDGDYETYSSSTSGVVTAMKLQSPNTLLRQGKQDGHYESYYSSPTSDIHATMEQQRPDNLIHKGMQDDGTADPPSGVDAMMEQQSPTKGTQDVVHLDAARGVGGNSDALSSRATMVPIVQEDMNCCTVCSRPFRQCKRGHLACGGCRAGQCQRCLHHGGGSFFAGGPCPNAVVADRFSVSPTSSMVERGDYTLVGNCSTSGCTTDNVEDDDHAADREVNSYGSVDEKMLEIDKIKFVVDQGFSKDEANMIINRIGVDSSLFILVDFKHEVPKISFGVINKARFKEESKKKRKYYGGREQGNQAPVDGSHDEPMTFPNPMVGFSLPGDIVRSDRRLPELANGPPFFYYENVARAPKGVWRTISEKLYDVEPEFVDSIYFCAAARKRGYIHNLPIKNRESLLPVPPKTIFEAFPHYKKWWPPWDPRSQLNCLSTCVPSTKLSEQIECVIGRSDNTPSLSVQQDVKDACKKYNLMWVGKNMVASLEPHEMEYLLGFPKDHTRVVGITKRYKSLGNSFQVDTVAYHLSVLRDMFPDGMKVLSLFSGIGGAEVALHSLEIHLRIVVSVEICKVNRRILRGWWNQTQTGQLIEIPDVHNLTDDIVEHLTKKFGGFDLVIGGSPCNNLAGRNRFHRDGLEGEQSALFYHYFRILDAVKSVMARM